MQTPDSEIDYWLYGRDKDTITSQLATQIMELPTFQQITTTQLILKDYGPMFTTHMESKPRDQLDSFNME